MRKFWDKYYKIICAIVLIISVGIIVQCYHNDKININTLSQKDMITVSENVKGLGKINVSKLVEH